MSEITVPELTFLLCLTCLSLATMTIWACHQLAPRVATARSQKR